MSFVVSMRRITESRWFNTTSTLVIIIYAAFVGFRTFSELAQPIAGIVGIIDWLVTGFFMLEIIAKMAGLGSVAKFFKDGWNTFDFIIVILSLIPFDLFLAGASEASEIVLVSRILRVFRVLRLFNARPELKKILNTVFKAFPAILDVGLLLFIIIYVYSVVGSLLFHAIDPGKWDNFLQSALTLFSILTFEGWVEVMEKTMAVYPWAWAYFLSFILFGVFIAFNLFIAVLNDRIQNYKEADNPTGGKAEPGTEPETVAELTAKIGALERKIDLLIASKKD